MPQQEAKAEEAEVASPYLGESLSVAPGSDNNPPNAHAMRSRSASSDFEEEKSNGFNFWLYALLGMLALGLCGYGVSQFVPMVLLSPGFVATMSTAAIYPPLVMMVLGLVLAIVMLVSIVKAWRSDSSEVGSVSMQSMSQADGESKSPSLRGSDTGSPFSSRRGSPFPDGGEGPELIGREHGEDSVGNDEQPNTEKKQSEGEQPLSVEDSVDCKGKDSGFGVDLALQIKDSVKTPVNPKPSKSVGKPTKEVGFARQTPAILGDAVGRSNSPCDPPTRFFKRVSKSSNNNKAAEVYRESPKKSDVSYDDWLVRAFMVDICNELNLVEKSAKDAKDENFLRQVKDLRALINSYPKKNQMTLIDLRQKMHGEEELRNEKGLFSSYKLYRLGSYSSKFKHDDPQWSEFFKADTEVDLRAAVFGLYLFFSPNKSVVSSGNLAAGEAEFLAQAAPVATPPQPVATPPQQAAVSSEILAPPHRPLPL